jgi:menaquinone-dependent protoporphyrinogen oxidase
MTRVLVAFATSSGSTAEVARAVGEELAQAGLDVDVAAIDDVRTLAGYDAVVVGAPMILGWHRDGKRFLRRHRRTLQRLPLAVFVMAMSLTRTREESLGVPVVLDSELPRPPRVEGRLDLRERYARLSNYVKPILKAARPASPVSVGVFGGRLEYGRLRWWAVLFAMVLIRAEARDRRNWPAIRSWAASLPAAFRLEEGKKTVYPSRLADRRETRRSLAGRKSEAAQATTLDGAGP